MFFVRKAEKHLINDLSRIADEIIDLVKNSVICQSAKNQKMLRDTNTIIVPHRSLTAYLGYDVIENSLKGSNIWE